MRKWLQLTMVFLVTVAGVTLGAPSRDASAAPQTWRGFFLFDSAAASINAAGFNDFVRINLQDDKCNPWGSGPFPSQIEPYLRNPVWHVLINSGGKSCGYDYQKIRSLIEQPFPRDPLGKSWSTLFRAYPDVEFILEIGNEPSFFWPQADAWTQRWWMIAVYDELARNAYGHIDQPWRQKYPNLAWAVAVGVPLNYTQIHLTYLSGEGSVLVTTTGQKRYDYVTIHRYSDGDVRSITPDWQGTWDYVINQRSDITKVLLTEFGIHCASCVSPGSNRVNAYRWWINTQTPAKVKGVLVYICSTLYFSCNPQDPNFIFDYQVKTSELAAIVGDHWGTAWNGLSCD